MTIVGARPQFVKSFPLSEALFEAGFFEQVIHTGQHYDDALSKLFFDELSLKPPICNLDINGVDRDTMISLMMNGLDSVLKSERPDMVIVFGDTNSTLAGALAAASNQIPVAHVEAGVRSFSPTMVEEINRISTGKLSTLHFCPTLAAVKNLAKEGIDQNVYFVGDLMKDATRLVNQRSRINSRILETLGLRPHNYSVATIHRAENTDRSDRFHEILNYLENVAKEQTLIMPLHPRTRVILRQISARPKGVTFIEPVGYIDMMQLIGSAVTVFTDSGGLQKEAYFHRVPCVTLRDETEWTETIEAGWNRLWTQSEFKNPRRNIDDWEQGDAAPKIAKYLSAWFGLNP
jgi:UDP-GlcNAc3NAcA epimerase